MSDERCTCLRFVDGLGEDTGKRHPDPECPVHRPGPRVGDRVEYLAGPYPTLYRYQRGTVTRVAPGVVYVKWDDGSELGMLPFRDEMRVIERTTPERCPVCGGLNPGDVTHTRC